MALVGSVPDVPLPQEHSEAAATLRASLVAQLPSGLLRSALPGRPRGLENPPALSGELSLADIVIEDRR